MVQEVEAFKQFIFTHSEKIYGNIQGAGNGMASMGKTQEAELMQQMKSKFPNLFEYAQQSKSTIEETGNKRFSVVSSIRRNLLGISSHPLPPDGIPPPMLPTREMGDEEWWFEYHWDFNAIILLMIDRVGIDEVKTIMDL